MASTASDRERLEEEFRKLLFGVRRSVRYHARRRRFYERIHDWVLFVAVSSGSATVVAFGSELTARLPDWVKMAVPAVVTVAALADLVVGSMRKASLHSDLGRRFIALERRLVAAGSSPSEPALVEATQERLAIESDEPPALRVLDTLCHNELLRAMGYPASEFVRVTAVQRLLANWADFRFDAPPR